YLHADVGHPLISSGKTAIRQQEEKFFAAVTAGNIVGSQGSGTLQRKLCQDQIARVVSVHVVESLEMIDVQHGNRHRGTAPLCPPNLPRQGFHQVATVEESGERI